MVRVVTQTTYDEVVQENINDFDMSPEEAIADAVKQFEAQGVNLSNIIKDLILSGTADNHSVVVSVQSINKIINSPPLDTSQLVKELEMLKSECDKDMAHKLMASSEAAYPALINCFNHSENNPTVIKATLAAAVSLMDGQPDLLETEGINRMNKLLDSQADDEIVIATLQWVATCCLKHEINRQKIFDAKILSHLKIMLETHKDSKILTQLCCVLRYLVLDDDVRVEFGRAHEHARLIAIETLPILTELLSSFKSDEKFVGDILITIATLVVRHEFCERVEEAGGLKFILDVMVEFHDKEKLNRQCFKLLKALAGNDDVKRNVIKQGAAPLICSALDRHKNIELLASAGLGCVAALALREIENSKALFDVGLPEVILQCMNIHKDKLNVQKNASWCIRNMVARCPDQRPRFLELGAEELLNEALKNFSAEFGYDIKAALKDLGCNVKLEEQWTGKGGKIYTSANHKFESELETIE